MTSSKRIFIGGKRTKSIFIGGRGKKTHRKGGKNHRGGDASDYVMGVAGDVSQQTANTFNNLNSFDSNALVVNGPNGLTQVGGKRRGRGKKTRKRKTSCSSFWGGAPLTSTPSATTTPSAINSVASILNQLKGQITPTATATQKGGTHQKQNGGFWGNILSQATTPLAILGLQQSFRRRRSQKRFRR